MKIINDYFEKHDIMWEKLAGFCTDGVLAVRITLRPNNIGERK